MKDKPDSVLLASGGLDSTTLAYWLAAKGIGFVPLFLDYGQHCVTTEFETLRRVLPPESAREINRVCLVDIYHGTSSRLIQEADLWRDSMAGDPLYLPYRNLLLMTAGAAFAQSRGYSRLFAGFINSNHAKEIDCSAEFFDTLANVLADYGAVRIELPFRDMSKVEVARAGVALGAPIALTFSCQASSEIPCGACPNCVDRLDALKALTEAEA